MCNSYNVIIVLFYYYYTYIGGGDVVVIVCIEFIIVEISINIKKILFRRKTKE